MASARLGLPNTYKFTASPCPSPELLASFTPSDLLICQGDCITFTDNSSGSGGATISGWSWQFAGATPASTSGQNPGQVCFNTPGAHNVTLTVTDGSLTDDTTIVIQVNPLPLVTATASPSPTICSGIP